MRHVSTVVALLGSFVIASTHSTLRAAAPFIDDSARLARDTVVKAATSVTNSSVTVLSAHQAARKEIVDAFHEKMQDHKVVMKAVLDDHLSTVHEVDRKDALARERRHLEDTEMEELARARDAAARTKAAKEQTVGDETILARKAAAALRREKEAQQAVASSVTTEEADSGAFHASAPSWEKTHPRVAQYRMMRQGETERQRQLEYEAMDSRQTRLEDVLNTKHQAKASDAAAAEPDKGPAHWFEITGQLEKLALKEQARREQGDYSFAWLPRAFQPIVAAGVLVAMFMMA